jgi:hypothetical protein
MEQLSVFGIRFNKIKNKRNEQNRNSYSISIVEFEQTIQVLICMTLHHEEKL